jgi:succinate dehydrogenase/fumarate reductase-like Fe-S protein
VNAFNANRARTIKSAHLRIWRGTSREAGRYEEFDVPFEDGDSVLDALVRIRFTKDPDLAFQFSCFNANVCKECTVSVNGNIDYACTSKLKEGITQIDPVPGQRILRDLIVDTQDREQRGVSLRRGMQLIGRGKVP